MPCRPHGNSGGFTLVELLVVLAIVGLALGIAVPLLGKRLPNVALAAGAGELRGVLRAARAAAIAEGRPIAFLGDPAGGYWLDRRHYRLGSASDPANRLRIVTAGASRISFLPSGGSSGGRILVEGTGGRRELAIEPITGRVVLLR